MPLSDRDYMQQRPRQSSRRSFKLDLGMNPVWALIIANVALFLAVELSSQSLYPFGPLGQVSADRFTYYLGLIPYYFTDRPWTLVTSMFIHSGFGHLFGNMITLFFFGMFFNRLVGGARLLLVYFIGGIVGNLVYLLLGNDFSVVIGASGAIYAITGAMVVMVPRLTVNLYFLFPVPLWIVVLVFFVAWSFVPGVAWQAHLGGLAAGLIAGFFFRRRIRVDFYR